jgi:hypothetical protein
MAARENAGANFSPHGAHEAETNRKVSGTRYSPMGMPPVTYFLQVDPTSRSLYHFLINPSSYKPINGLVH